MSITCVCRIGKYSTKLLDKTCTYLWKRRYKLNRIIIIQEVIQIITFFICVNFAYNGGIINFDGNELNCRTNLQSFKIYFLVMFEQVNKRKFSQCIKNSYLLFRNIQWDTLRIIFVIVCIVFFVTYIKY